MSIKKPSKKELTSEEYQEKWQDLYFDIATSAPREATRDEIAHLLNFIIGHYIGYHRLGSSKDHLELLRAARYYWVQQFGDEESPADATSKEQVH